MKIKTILFSQNPPQIFDKSPYADLVKKYNIKINFYKFFRSEEISQDLFRKQRLNLSEYTAVIMTSKKVVDYFFSLMDKMKIAVSNEMHYYCINEIIAFYLQKHIVFRKRKIFYGNGEEEDLIKILQENPEEKYLYLCAIESSANTLGAMMDSRGVVYKKSEIYGIVYEDLTEIDLKSYDMIVFFSPHGIESLKAAYPDYEQGKTMIGVLGTQVLEAAKAEGFRVDVSAPTPETPSIFTAIDRLLQKTNGRRR